MREIRIALLESDVSISVAKEFIEKVKIKAKGRGSYKKCFSCPDGYKNCKR